jgi:hypothetical protein
MSELVDQVSNPLKYFCPQTPWPYTDLERERHLTLPAWSRTTEHGQLNEGVAIGGAPLSEGLGASVSSPPVMALTVIAPSHGWAPLKLSELWEYRDVLYLAHVQSHR